MSLFLFSNCRDDNFITDSSAQLQFSTDTLTFDTVFTTFGSITRSFRVINTHNRPIKIANLRLARLQNEQFRINVDGIPGDTHSEIEIPGKDSIWVFVEVTVNDPSNENLPFVLVDEVQFTTNGNLQKVHLQAWGQSAHFHFGEVVCNEVWENDKPHVVVGGNGFPGVHVDSMCTLTINAGTKVFFHANAGLFVSGSLIIDGTDADSVTFEGDRLERFFDQLPGQWLGVFLLRGSGPSEINYAVIDESSFAVSAGSSFNPDLTTFDNASRPEVSIKNSILKNAFNNAIFGFNAKIYAENSLFYNSSENLVALSLGGDYQFENCTFFNSGSVVTNHESENILLGNVIESNQGIFINGLDQARFTNCLIYGTLEEELSLNDVEDSVTAFNYTFDHCLIRTEQDTSLSNFLNCLINIDPQVESVFEENFALSEFSPCIDAGIDNGLSIDIDDQPRPVGANYDIGAYERQ